MLFEVIFSKGLVPFWPTQPIQTKLGLIIVLFKWVKFMIKIITKSYYNLSFVIIITKHLLPCSEPLLAPPSLLICIFFKSLFCFHREKITTFNMVPHMCIFRSNSKNYKYFCNKKVKKKLHFSIKLSSQTHLNKKLQKESPLHNFSKGGCEYCLTAYEIWNESKNGNNIYQEEV